MGDVEIVGRVERRRKWSAEEKAALLAEVEAEGGKVSLVARRHGISDSLIYNWRSAWRAAASMRPSEPVEFVPIGMIEIALPGGARVSVDTFVNEKALARVFRALKGMA